MGLRQSIGGAAVALKDESISDLTAPVLPASLAPNLCPHCLFPGAFHPLISPQTSYTHQSPLALWMEGFGGVGVLPCCAPPQLTVAPLRPPLCPHQPLCPPPTRPGQLPPKPSYPSSTPLPGR
ncbi:hypothetical protein DPEC_G00063210 [Dallia pectoralis]|uniref:Uncharacterized protein n=1 Tax=Dallia pectoralis TaxID=75939 RepID=A0ACC2H7C0_DALPE|nr:hypothetical protein DPEC_G00063210 [Dallia pectoralis]